MTDAPGGDRAPQDEAGDDLDLGELSEAARRGMQRAGVHLMKAAIEVVAGLGAFLEEIQAASPRRDGDGDDEDGPQHIEVE
jgi:hypothetical protein